MQRKILRALLGQIDSGRFFSFFLGSRLGGISLPILPCKQSESRQKRGLSAIALLSFARASKVRAKADRGRASRLRSPVGIDRTEEAALPVQKSLPGNDESYCLWERILMFSKRRTNFEWDLG